MAIKLRGITWNHSRGYVPMVATAQLFLEMNPGVEIVWDKRSLQAFADYPIQKLIEQYDLLVIDHPWAGFAANSGALIPLEKHLPAEFLADQAAHSVGMSHISYNFDGYQTALAIDAATPVASYRPDLLQRHQVEVPQRWEDVLLLAKRGLVAMPGIPVDTLMNFYMLCISQGEELFVDEERMVSNEMGLQALEQLRELTGSCSREIFQWNPIAVYQAMSSRNDVAYCPFAYGYSNYSRSGYAKYKLQFGDLVSIGTHGRLRTTLGGTGLAISAACGNLDAALAYSQFVASPECQRTVYYENGGQPGHRGAWTDQAVNQTCSSFFIETLPALDHAYLRPRYNGYMHFQDHAGAYIFNYLSDGGNPNNVLDELNRLYRESRHNV